MEKELKRMQLFYVGALIDALKQYDNNNILEKVTLEKEALQKISAKGQLSYLQIKSIKELYDTFSNTFACAYWTLSEDDNQITSKTSTCLLCSLAKKQGIKMPCKIYCINPFKALAKELGYTLKVKETLWNTNQCVFEHKKIITK